MGGGWGGGGNQKYRAQTKHRTFNSGKFPRLGLLRRSQVPTGQRPIKIEEMQADQQQASNQVKGRYHDQG